MSTLQNITNMLLESNTKAARLEIQADMEARRIFGINQDYLTSMQRRDLLQACDEIELTKENVLTLLTNIEV